MNLYDRAGFKEGMSSTRIVVAIAAIVSTSVAGLFATTAFQQIVNAVNQRIQKEQQFDPVWWYLPKNRRLMAEYRRLYPDGKLQIKYRILLAAAFVSLLVGVWAMGFFR